MTTKESATCGVCGAGLAWLGSQTQRTADGRSVAIVHWECASCRRKWVHHSERGWRETNVDLRAD
jgi:hypothetical protein